MNKRNFLMFGVLLFAFTFNAARASTVIANLRVEYMKNPVGLDVAAPRFSWQMESEITGIKQDSYEIIVSYDVAGSDIVWNSGVVHSEQSVGIQYAGTTLLPSTRYYWTVNVSDNFGSKSSSTEEVFFETGLMSTGWSGAKWLKINGNNTTGIPMFRSEFTVTKDIKTARIYSSGLGIYDMFINEKRVGTPMPDGTTVYDELKPGWTDYRKTVFYSTYNITNLLISGKNAIGAHVSPGWLSGLIARGVYGDPALGFIAKILIEYTDGTSDMMVTDTEHWKVSNHSAIQMADIYDGETYDARKESNWTAPGFDASGWSQPEVNEFFKGDMISFIGQPVQVRPELALTPSGIVVYDGILSTGSTFGKINVVRTMSGTGKLSLKSNETAIYDFGQNFVGWIKFKVKGNAGTNMRARFAEMLNDSGEQSRGNDHAEGTVYLRNLRAAKATLNYILKGDPEGETYHPSMTFFGFRYCEITTTNDIEIEFVTGEVVGSANEESSSFITNNEHVNQLYNNVVWGQRGNYLSIPTDCPQRNERLGWMGDTQIFSRAAAYHADVASFFHKWAKDVRDSQQANGAYPSVVPETSNLGYGCTGWAEAGIIVPWNMYLMYHDRNMIGDHYASMEKFMAWMEAQKFDGYLYNGGETRYGDWLAYEETDNRFISVCYYAYIARLMTKISKALSQSSGDMYEQNADKYQALYDNIKTEFQTRYVHPSTGLLRVNTQTAYLLALKNDLFPSIEATNAAVAYLVNIIRNNGNRLSTGFLGTGTLNQTLSEYGASNMAYSLLLQRGNPSWLYSVMQGATTIWERWNSYTIASGFGDPGMNSFNHYAYGAVSEWMYCYMAGIETDENNPGFKHIILQPAPDLRNLPVTERMTKVDATHGSYYGNIRSKWEQKSNENITYSVTIPANTTATLYILKVNHTTTIERDGNPIQIVDGVSSFIEEDNRFVLELLSGSYTFDTFTDDFGNDGTAGTISIEALNPIGGTLKAATGGYIGANPVGIATIDPDAGKLIDATVLASDPATSLPVNVQNGAVFFVAEPERGWRVKRFIVNGVSCANATGGVYYEVHPVNNNLITSSTIIFNGNNNVGLIDPAFPGVAYGLNDRNDNVRMRPPYTAEIINIPIVESGSADVKVEFEKELAIYADITGVNGALEGSDALNFTGTKYGIIAGPCWWRGVNSSHLTFTFDEVKTINTMRFYVRGSNQYPPRVRLEFFDEHGDKLPGGDLNPSISAPGASNPTVVNFPHPIKAQSVKITQDGVAVNGNNNGQSGFQRIHILEAPEVTVGSNVINAEHGTIQMFVAGIIPRDATDISVESFEWEWSVDNASVATIDKTTGVLTAQYNGSVVVRATGTTTDGTVLFGEKTITISGQTDEPADVPVTSITVTGADGATTITDKGGTLQMQAAVLPDDATDKTVVWSAVNGTGEAAINAGGLLTAVADGTLTVKATANDGSGVEGVLEVAISGQTITGAESVFAPNLNIYPNPFGDAVRITGAEGWTLRIMDAAGMTVHTRKITGADETIQLEQLSAGVYFFRMEKDGQTKTVKVVKE